LASLCVKSGSGIMAELVFLWFSIITPAVVISLGA
jgi:hypothetical protein